MNLKPRAYLCLGVALFVFLSQSHFVYAAIAGGAASRATNNAARGIEDQNRKYREMKKQAQKQKEIDEEGGLVTFAEDYK